MKILDGTSAGINQIISAERQFPLDLYEESWSNTWRPAEVNMGLDSKEWKSGVVSDDEKLIIKRALGFFSAGESSVNNNIFLSEYRYITDGACRQYLTKKAIEEAEHNKTVTVCLSAYNLNKNEVEEAYLNIPSVKDKTDFLLRNTTDILEDPNFDITTTQGKKKFLRNIFLYYIICEGTFFWSSFIMLLSICRTGKLQGLYKQIKFTIVDESNHLKFGIYLINEIKENYPELWDEDFTNDLIKLLKEAVDLEISYAKDTIPNPMLGFNADMFVDFMKYVGNRRLESVGLDYKFDSDRNPFPWVEEVLEAKTLTAFFEQRETEYRTSGDLEDDF